MGGKKFMAAATMTLLISVPAAVAEVFEVRQSGFLFTPDKLEIQPGDTVRWIWGDGFHTVTHGVPCDPDPNALFDAPLDPDNTPFEFTFDTPGEVPYFCKFHCLVNMTGSIVVQGEGELLCDGVKKTKFKCKKGKLKWAVKMVDNRNEGRKLAIVLDGPDPRRESVEVSGRKVKGKFKNVAPGAYTAGIEGCPDLDREVQCG